MVGWAAGAHRRHQRHTHRRKRLLVRHHGFQHTELDIKEGLGVGQRALSELQVKRVDCGVTAHEPNEGLHGGSRPSARHRWLDYGHQLRLQPVRIWEHADQRRLVEHGPTNGTRMLEREPDRDDRSAARAEHHGGRGIE